MGTTRNASSGDKGGSLWKALNGALANTGATVPHSSGGGNKHNNRRRGRRNPTGATMHAPKEWGTEDRKWEERLTGLARRAKDDAISEGLTELLSDDFDAKITAEEVAQAEAWRVRLEDQVWTDYMDRFYRFETEEGENR